MTREIEALVNNIELMRNVIEEFDISCFDRSDAQQIVEMFEHIRDLCKEHLDYHLGFRPESEE